MLPAGTWFSAGAMRVLPYRAPGCFQLQKKRGQPELWCTSHGRKRGLRKGILWDDSDLGLIGYNGLTPSHPDSAHIG
jgi:hypothetical protein